MADDEALLVDADGGADHLRRNAQKLFVERAHQRNRPFDEAGNFVEQRLVFDQFVALREGEVLCLVEHDLLAPRRVEHDLRLFELGHVVVEAFDAERRWTEEAVAARLVARRDPVDRKAHDLRLLGLRPERRDDRMQRPHPLQRARPRRALAPAHRLWPREGADDDRQHLGEHVDRRAPGLFDQRDIEVALLRVLLDRRLGKRGKPCAAQKARDRIVGRADPRPLLLLLEVGLARGNALHRQREP